MQKETFNKEVYEKLKQLVKAPYPFITYEDLNIECNLGLNFDHNRDRKILGDILGTISVQEVREGRPMLSAIVILKDSHPPKPSFGFFECAKKLGILKRGESQDVFYIRQLKELGIK
ncbi:MAG: hypothetical protein OIN90_02695 [Candidatus Methanoperedens sp.]|nr:hypothetical protein [Candidatus Methanoperedens sp.]